MDRAVSRIGSGFIEELIDRDKEFDYILSNLNDKDSNLTQTNSTSQFFARNRLHLNAHIEGYYYFTEMTTTL